MRVRCFVSSKKEGTVDEVWGTDETCLIFVDSLGNWNCNRGSCGRIVVRRSPGDKYEILSSYPEFLIHSCSTITPFCYIHCYIHKNSVTLIASAREDTMPLQQ